MSKKLAEGTEGLVLDVKSGSGAFMKNDEDAKELATAMVNIGNAMGVRTVAVITDMNEPLGMTIGNALEMKECLTAFRGNWANDLREVTMTLSAWMLTMADSLTEETSLKFLDNQTKKRYINEAADFIEKGDAFKKFAEFVDAQHGDAEAAFKPAMLPAAKETKQLFAQSEGFIRRLDAESVGRASMLLGAGREKAGDEIDPAAGIVLTRKTGEYVKEGEPLAMFHYGDMAKLDEAADVFFSGIEIGTKEPAPRKLIRDVVMPPEK
jgi:thymidine phosphorylase